MPPTDPLRLAASIYTAELWDEYAWRQFGRDTGTSDILNSHPRLYRSLSFGDPDYQDACHEVLGTVLAEGAEPLSGEQGRMELIADSMPELPIWTKDHAPSRTKRLFATYLAERDASEIPAIWKGDEANGESDAAKSDDEMTWIKVPSTPVSTPNPPAVLPSQTSLVGEVAPTPLATSASSDSGTQARSNIFIVHGHDTSAMNSIRVFVQREAGNLPVSLAEEVGRGRTIIEKFEDYGEEAAFVIVLLTPDDVGQTNASHVAGEDPTSRARQNVIMELGYFIARLGRSNVVVMDAGVERPSDINGVSYIAYPGENWKYELREELKAADLI